MATELKTWQIIDGKLVDIASSLAAEGRTEPNDLEQWLVSNPQILGSDLLLIGRQVQTDSGPIDILAIDGSGNLVVVELKRDRLPRESLAQAIDYAAAIADWSIDKVSEVCCQFCSKSLDEALSERFPDVGLESLSVNEQQRIILVGCSIEASLERMVDWLSTRFNIGINAIILTYVKTRSGDELIARTAMISEEVEHKRVKSAKKFTIPMSDDPGTYERDDLRQKLQQYLSKNMYSARRIRDVLLPSCLKQRTVSRDQLKDAFMEFGEADDLSQTGYFISLISNQVGMAKNDFLRQVIGYEYPNNPWEKDNYTIREGYEDLVRDVLDAVGNATEVAD